ncbi:MAG: HD family phosphohydrolase [Bacteroidetes bacterium]|nr:MAG: HD family phosphohydrolase [Bacteroidota bacterium]
MVQVTFEELTYYKDWFTKYVNSFSCEDEVLQQNINIKKVHTYNVCKAIIDIGKSINLSQNDLYLAELIALFHDIGRFEQYARYRTFVDGKSENHAILGINVLREKDVLSNLKNSTADFILRCILYHNKLDLPKKESDKCLLFTKLIRDADKSDIFRVVTEYYSRSNKEKNPAIELDLPDNDEVSEKVLNDLMHGRMAKLEDLKVLNDFKLLQIGWVFDINFIRTYKIINENKYLEIIFNYLPKNDKIKELHTKINEFIALQFENKDNNFVVS